jgi:hypothetical protein
MQCPETKSILPTLSLISTIVLACAGYFVTYLNSLRLERRKAHLAFLGEQLRSLYGPLFSLQHTSSEAWDAFASNCWPERKTFFGDPSGEPTPEELRQWRLWMTEVFMPLNLQMEKIIIDNAHLIEGDGMPKYFLDFLSHVEVYKMVLAKWEKGDFTEHTAYITFPEEFGARVTKTYKKLKHEQALLLRNTAPT